jgi:hypothetical protein
VDVHKEDIHPHALKHAMQSSDEPMKFCANDFSVSSPTPDKMK